MAATESSSRWGILAELLSSEKRLLHRLAGVFRLDAAIYTEIEADPHAIPQALAVVIGTAVLVGPGQGSVAGIFVGIAGGIGVWAVVTGLVWGVALAFERRSVDDTRLLRCLGFAYVWNALQLGSSLPFLGPLFLWAALLLWLGSMVLATRQVLEVSTQRAATICAIALGTPVLLLWWAFA